MRRLTAIGLLLIVSCSSAMFTGWPTEADQADYRERAAKVHVGMTEQEFAGLWPVVPGRKQRLTGIVEKSTYTEAGAIITTYWIGNYQWNGTFAQQVLYFSVEFVNGIAQNLYEP